MADKYAWAPGTPPPIDDHSLAKHRIFRGYVRTYLERLTSNPRADRFKLTIVDGFAGGGEYNYAGGRVAGSPLIVLEEIRNAKVRLTAERRKPFSLEVDLICVEAKRSNYEYLRNLIETSEFRDQLDQSIFVIRSKFELKLPAIIDHINRRGRAPRALFLLDQYGYKDASLALVRQILEQIANSEVILTFAVDSLINYMSTQKEFLKAAAPVGLNLEKIKQLIELFEDSRNGRWLAENALYKHFQQATGAQYYTPFFVRSADSNRAYWLLHISKHPTARDVMGELHWQNQNTCSHYGGDGLFALGFDPDYSIPKLDFNFSTLDRERSTKLIGTQLPRIITDLTSSINDTISFEEFFGSLCNETPATKSIISEVAVSLRNEGELEIFDKEGKLKPRAQAVHWTDRIGRPSAPKIFGPWNFKK